MKKEGLKRTIKIYERLNQISKEPSLREKISKLTLILESDYQKPLVEICRVILTVLKQISTAKESP